MVQSYNFIIRVLYGCIKQVEIFCTVANVKAIKLQMNILFEGEYIMTKIYFVRHAEPVHSWEDDKTRPLTQEGIEDSKKITTFFKNIHIDIFISSPYERSVGTILGSAEQRKMSIITDERLRERRARKSSNNFQMMRKRWADFNFCEEDGENLYSVQKRNMVTLSEILSKYQDKNIVIGTHGTALSTILNNYNPAYNCDSFLRIIDFMPYILRMDFNGLEYLGQEELLIVKKDFKG